MISPFEWVFFFILYHLPVQLSSFSTLYPETTIKGSYVIVVKAPAIKMVIGGQRAPEISFAWLYSESLGSIKTNVCIFLCLSKVFRVKVTYPSS